MKAIRLGTLTVAMLLSGCAATAEAQWKFRDNGGSEIAFPTLSACVEWANSIKIGRCVADGGPSDQPPNSAPQQNPPSASQTSSQQWSEILHELSDVAAGIASGTHQNARGAKGFAYTVGALQFLSGAVGGQDAAKNLALTQLRAEEIFSDTNWSSLRAQRQILHSVAMIDPRSGQRETDDIEIAWAADLKTVNRWCSTLTTHSNACGCVRSYPPRRIIAYVGPADGCNPISWRQQGLAVPPDLLSTTRFELAHELWHLKGYWGHITNPDGAWPSHGNVPAPLRMPTLADVYGGH
jgi:hypothetical protein